MTRDEARAKLKLLGIPGWASAESVEDARARAVDAGWSSFAASKAFPLSADGGPTKGEHHASAAAKGRDDAPGAAVEASRSAARTLTTPKLRADADTSAVSTTTPARGPEEAGTSKKRKRRLRILGPVRAPEPPRKPELRLLDGGAGDNDEQLLLEGEVPEVGEVLYTSSGKRVTVSASLEVTTESGAKLRVKGWQSFSRKPVAQPFEHLPLELRPLMIAGAGERRDCLHEGYCLGRALQCDKSLTTAHCPPFCRHHAPPSFEQRVALTGGIRRGAPDV